jgi:hypothetical protein
MEALEARLVPLLTPLLAQVKKEIVADVKEHLVGLLKPAP